MGNWEIRNSSPDIRANVVSSQGVLAFDCKNTQSHNYKFLMIFGFNTDVKHGDTIYHVQSEARESEKLLQTQVFVRGRCIGKRAVSYATSAAESGFGDPRLGDPQLGDPQKEQQLRDQHRLVLEAIREGQLENVLDRAETEALASIKQLDVQWENASTVHANRSLTMQLRVTEDGAAVNGAKLTFRFARPDAAPFYTQGVTNAAGNAELSIEVE